MITKNAIKAEPNKGYPLMSEMKKANEVSVDVNKNKAVKTIVPHDRLKEAKILKNSVQLAKK